jgi:ubiquitin C-terminal hydrolase
MPNDYYQYELKGTVIHMGFADAGHYYSLIRERTGEQMWFEFNDNIVRPFNPEKLP